jgi:NIPSNAP
LRDFQVIEFRRYTVKEDERDRFARYFETYFPEAFQQLGSLIHGHFLEGGNRSVFTWIRGFHDYDARATVNEAFYRGPLWKEHAATMNDRLIDHTNVLLLRPLRPEREVSVLPTVDPIREAEGAQGLVIAQVFAIQAGGVDAFAREAEPTFSAYRAAGVREAGVLVTLDEPNNFPGLPFRTDGPYLVWLGIVRDERIYETRVKPSTEGSLKALSASKLLRGAPESIVLRPARRSRLRWLPEWTPSP